MEAIITQKNHINTPTSTHISVCVCVCVCVCHWVYVSVYLRVLKYKFILKLDFFLKNEQNMATSNSSKRI